MTWSKKGTRSKRNKSHWEFLPPEHTFQGSCISLCKFFLWHWVLATISVWDLSLHLSFFYFVFNPLGLVKLVWPSYPASSTLYNKRQRSSYRLQKSKLIKLGYFCMKKLKIFHVHCIANIPTLDDWYDKKVDWKKIEKHENIFLKHCLFHEIYFETWIIIYCMRDE